MKRLINMSTILSLALYVVPPFAAHAQDLTTVMVGNQAVICLPNKKTACPDGAVCTIALKPENCQANAEKTVAKLAGGAANSDQAAADAAAADKAAADQAAADQAAAQKAAADQAAADQAAAAKAAADKAAADQAAAQKAAADQAAADKAAADQAAAQKAAADQAAADQAAADKAAVKKAAAAEKAAARKAADEQAAAQKAAADQAAADQAAAEKAAADQAAANKAGADQAAADKAAADKAAADQAAADQAAANKAGADQAAADKAAADKAAADQAAADQAAADKAASDQAAADKAAADKAAAKAAKANKPDTKATVPAATAGTEGTAPATFPTVVVNGTTVICLPDKAAVCPDGANCVVAAKVQRCQTLAEKKLAGSTADQAAADKAAADKAAADKAAADKAAADKAVADKAAADKVAADQAAADKAATDQAAADKAAADKAAADKAAADQAAAVQAAAEKGAADQAAMDKASIAAAQKAQKAAAKAAAADPKVKVIVAPVAEQQAVTTLQTVLIAPAGPDASAVAAAAAAAAVAGLAAPAANQPPPAGAQVTTETVTAADTRTSAQNFAAAPVVVAPGKKTGLSDLEKVGLVALGALVIGAIINGNKQVVSNTGDRVVVRQDDGSYQVYKDDNSLLREPGAKVTTQTFKDGSTRTIFVRPDGSQIVTIRDASGRVLQRVAYDKKGHGTVLIDDLRPERPINVVNLPKPQPNNHISVDDTNAEMRAALAAANTADVGQSFSLRQVRLYTEVRLLAPTIDVPPVTFATGSAAIDPSEAQKLNKLGKFITTLVAKNPGEVFLIEGHTDAVGSAASNLALSDQRAESLAKALTEYFQVPPENLVVQGYGESELLVNTPGDERANRRVVVRIITSLLDQKGP